MTGIFIRIMRDDRWQNIDIAEMTDQEVEDAMSSRDAKELTRWVVTLAREVRTLLSEEDGR